VTVLPAIEHAVLLVVKVTGRLDEAVAVIPNGGSTMA
jgi:hypothetical protein